MNYLSSFVEILKQFTSGQRLLVLILLLVFTSGTYLLAKHWQQTSCKETISENVQMQKDFAEIAKMLREERMQNVRASADEERVTAEVVYDSVIMHDTMFTPLPSGETAVTTSDKILKIVDKYKVDGSN